MTHPNLDPKYCSKCSKMPKSNFSFLGATFMVVGYAEMTHPNLKIRFSNVHMKLKFTSFLFRHKISVGRRVDCKMHLLTSHEMIFVVYMFSPISILGGQGRVVPCTKWDTIPFIFQQHGASHD